MLLNLFILFLVTRTNLIFPCDPTPKISKTITSPNSW